MYVEKKKPGRPVSVDTKRAEKIVRQTMDRNSYVTKDDVLRTLRKKKVTMSASGLKRTLRRMGFRAYCSSPAIILSDKNREKRVNWASHHLKKKD